MKSILVLASLFFVYSSYSQQGEELLVYSLKGNVTVIENDKESKVKIGKVLKPGSTLKTQKLAKLTMVCKEGKALTVTKEGSFPIIRWKDSCETNNHNSVTSKYFKYIWEQLYMRSEDFKKNSAGDIAAVVRNEAPVRGEDDMEILSDDRADRATQGINQTKGDRRQTINRRHPGHRRCAEGRHEGGDEGDTKRRGQIGQNRRTGHLTDSARICRKVR